MPSTAHPSVIKGEIACVSDHSVKGSKTPFIREGDAGVAKVLTISYILEINIVPLTPFSRWPSTVKALFPHTDALDNGIQGPLGAK